MLLFIKFNRPTNELNLKSQQIQLDFTIDTLDKKHIKLILQEIQEADYNVIIS
ncbi:hypothetical protein [Spiroplasma endosymbiont of Clivina fossor]|uniref:hypothetical protein n=1 Tax=Spiroplasma endosymbiont of Clivina fossor TaxID=3066282 RepID=UPI00313C4538